MLTETHRKYFELIVSKYSDSFKLTTDVHSTIAFPRFMETVETK